MNGVPGGPQSRDSSLSLSPVPSPRSHQPFLDNIIVSHAPYPQGFSGGGVAAPNIADAKNTTAATVTTTDKVKRPRKKKDPAAEEPKDDAPKEKKPRKPRASNPDSAAARKKQKTADNPPPPSLSAAMTPTSRQPAISEMLARPTPSAASTKPTMASLMAPVVKSEPSTSAAAIANPQARPVSSGQRYYDPIRGMTVEAPPAPSPQPRQAPAPPPSVPQPTFTKPSSNLASLMNPTVAAASTAQPSNPASSYGTFLGQHSSSTTAQDQQRPSSVAPPVTVSTMQAKVESRPPVTASRPNQSQSTTSAVAATAKDLDTEGPRPIVKTLTEDKAVSKQSTAAPTPKEKRSPPRPTGSGLLSSSDLFGGIGAADDGKTRKGVDININIQLNPAGGNTINIAQEIMKKYGRDAINPRAAAHRERLLQVAAAANRLEQGSDDDMSIDGSDGADDSNIEMGGMGDDRSTAGEGADGKKRRRRKVEDYDKEDDFIDDTEMAWQESAAVAKDGFFVYSGPLVRKEEKAATERTATSTRGRGRGRGRARVASGTTHATAAAAKTEASSPTASTTATRGRGRGGRGGGTGQPRKPRPKPQLFLEDREALIALEIARQEAAKAAVTVS